MKAKTILLYGRTRAGKSTQIGEMAEYVKTTTGKNTRLYTADRGGIGPLLPYIDLGVVEVVAQQDTNPWIFMNQAARGRVRDIAGKWVDGDNSSIGMCAFESMTSFADALMNDLAKQAGNNVNIGGAANVSFSVQGDNETLKISGNNMGHYNVVQSRITDEVWASQLLPVDYVLWTASVSKDADELSTSKVLGPQVVGKALTTEVPRWFELCFRIDAIPSQAGKPERHILYLGNSVDQASGNAVSLGNTRTPLDSKPLPASIEPASLVGALKLINQTKVEALEAIKKRMSVAPPKG